MALVEAEAAARPYCYVTTTGRRSGNPHTIEIWFAAVGDSLLLLSGGRERSDWVANLRADAAARVRIDSTTYSAAARFPEPGSEEDALARRLLVTKYRSAANDLAEWGRTSLAVALDLKRVETTDPAAALWPKRRRRG